MVACCEIGIIHLVLLISQKDYVPYNRRINKVCARHAVTTFCNSGFKENKIGSPPQVCGDRECRVASILAMIVFNRFSYRHFVSRLRLRLRSKWRYKERASLSIIWILLTLIRKELSMATYYIGANVDSKMTELAIKKNEKIVRRYRVPTSIPAIREVLTKRIRAQDSNSGASSTLWF